MLFKRIFFVIGLKLDNWNTFIDQSTMRFPIDLTLIWNNY